MVQTGVGRIVNTSSITAFDGGGTFSKGDSRGEGGRARTVERGGARELGRVGSPQDIAAMAAFLLSEAAGFISWATYQVDGGKYMH
jgi:NAD(P)-dependent dehydrogenase (short-subunit alcohol dehydrogenase family)